MKLSLGNLYIQKEEPDRGLPYVEQALAYYREGAYGKEVSKCLIMLGRARLLKGDYDAAIKIFDEQLGLARQVEDPEQVARSQAEIGSALAKQEMYPAALSHFNESYGIYKSLNNPLNTAFSLVNRADMLARLGQYAEAHAALDELFAELKRLASDNNYKALWTAWAYLIKARMALSERRLPEAKAKCLQALAAIAPQNKNTIVMIKATLGLIQVLDGARAKGKKDCEEAVSMALTTDDARLLSDARLVLAEALLEGRDGRDALTAALLARESFANLHKPESEWRARLIAARASQQIGDLEASQDQLQLSSDLLSSLRVTWGAEAFERYHSRQDIQLLYEQLP